jgi:hypothetical protein
MKKITLIEKVIDGRDIPLKSRDALLVALESYQEGLKGLKNVAMALRIHEKIRGSNGDLELENTEFDFLLSALDACQWSPMVLQFGEFFAELDRAKYTE